MRWWCLGLTVVVLLLGAGRPPGHLVLLGDVQRVGGVAAGPDTFYTLTAAGVQCWNAETGQLREVLKAPAGEDWLAMALSSQQTLAVAGRERGGSGPVQIRLLASGRRFGVEIPVQSMAFSPEGGVLACAGAGRSQVWVVEVGTGRVRWKLGDEFGRVDSAGALAFSPDGRLLAAGASGALLLWDLERGALRLKLPGRSGAARGVLFSPDGSRLYAALDGLSAFELAGGNLLWNLKGEGGALALSPDGRQLAWAGRDLRLVEAADGRVRQVTAPGFCKAPAVASSTGATYTPDGRRILTGGDGGARLWSAAGRWLGGLAVWGGPEPPWVSYAADSSFQAEPAALANLRYEAGGRLRLLKDFPDLENPEGVRRAWLP